MKPYFSLLRVRFLNGLQYRAAALGGLTTQFFWGIMLIFLYTAFYNGADSVGGFSYQNMITLIWLQQGFLSFVFMAEWDSEMLDMIISGGISYELLRPINLYQVWYMKLIAKRLSSGALRSLPIIIIAFFLPRPYNLSPPESALSLLLFFIALFLGLILLTALIMLVYISIFKTMSPIGSIGVLGILGEFFGGLTLPIPMMPDWLQRVCSILPFRWASDFSLRVYSGHIGTPDALIGILVQCGWIAFLVLLGAAIMKRVVRLKTVQGG